MKRVLIFITAFTIIMSFIYFYLDLKLFQFGLSNHNVFGYELALDLEPAYLGSDFSFPIVGFALIDKGGFLIVSKDKQIRVDGNLIAIKSILKYKTCEKSILIMVKNYKNQSQLLRVERSKIRKSSSFIFESIDQNSSLDCSSKDWVIIENNDKIQRLRLIKNINVLIYIAAVVLVFAIKYILDKANEDKTNALI